MKFKYLLLVFIIVFVSSSTLLQQQTLGSFNKNEQENKFIRTDDTSQKVIKSRKMIRSLEMIDDSSKKLKISQTYAKLPNSFTWQNKNVLSFNTQMKENCHPFWAFAGVSAYETSYAYENKQFIDFSEQWILSCRYELPPQYDVCDVGSFSDAIKKVGRNKGMPLEETLEYTQSSTLEDKNTCAEYDIFEIKTIVSLYTENPSFSIQQLKYLITRSPAVVMDMKFTVSSFINYDISKNNGLLECVKQEVDYQEIHLVGYNSTGNYLIGKGNFGSSWGHNGYVHISMDCLTGSNYIYNFGFPEEQQESQTPQKQNSARLLTFWGIGMLLMLLMSFLI